MTNSQADSDGGDGRRADGGEGSLTDEIPWKRAILLGVLAFAVGMVLVTGLVFAEGTLDDSPTDDADDVDGAEEDEPGFLSVIGWLYFGTQFVDIEVSGMLGSGSFDFFGLLMEDASIPEIVWRLVPVGVLSAAGYRLASRELEADATPEAGAKMGATVAVGYLLATIAGSQLFTFTDAETGESIGVAFTEAALLSGLLYPILFGALGGYLAFRE